MGNMLTDEQKKLLIETLEKRFEKNMHRHEKIEWAFVASKLNQSTDKLWSLYEMERTGGEPDVIGYDESIGKIIFCDCSKESPVGRRSICYDEQALEARKKNKPENSAMNMAKSMGIELLTEEQYRTLQKLEAFDTKSSSWIKTPSDIREKGGALFCDFRYGHVFIYHNGADSYYNSRGFRGILKI